MGEQKSRETPDSEHQEEIEEDQRVIAIDEKTQSGTVEESARELRAEQTA